MPRRKRRARRKRQAHIDQPRPPRDWLGGLWRAVQVVLFFAGCGAMLGATALVSGGLFKGYQAGWPKSTGSFAFLPTTFTPAFEVQIGIIVGGPFGALWGAICSLAAIPFLIRRRLWGPPAWLLPAHFLSMLALEYVPFTRDLGGGLGPLFVGGASFVFFYVRARERLPYRRAYRHEPGHCIRCKYDLTGNVSGRCPECGTELTEADTALLRSVGKSERLGQKPGGSG